MSRGGGHGSVASVVATYWFVSISFVYLNKVLMTSDGLSIPAPLFVTWFQCMVTTFICYGAGWIGENTRLMSTVETKSLTTSGNDNRSFFAQFPKAEYRISAGQKVLPLSIIFVGMITFNNLCLKWVEVSFYNVARSLTIVFNVILSAILLSQHTSLRTSMCLGLVIAGFFMGSNGEVNFSLKGTLAGVIGSLFVSLNSIYTKKILPAVENDEWRLTFYNNMNASILFLPLMLVFELGPLAQAVLSGQLLSGLFWAAMLVAGFLGFSIGVVTVLQIKATSPLTHNISGTAKAAVQSFLAFYIWGNPATFMGVMGIFVVLGGSLMYALVRINENKKPLDPPPVPVEKDVESELSERAPSLGASNKRRTAASG